MAASAAGVDVYEAVPNRFAGRLDSGIKRRARTFTASQITQHMGLKPGMRAYFYGAPADAASAIDSPDLTVGNTTRGTFDCIPVSATDAAERE